MYVCDILIIKTVHKVTELHRVHIDMPEQVFIDISDGLMTFFRVTTYFFQNIREPKTIVFFQTNHNVAHGNTIKILQTALVKCRFRTHQQQQQRTLMLIRRLIPEFRQRDILHIAVTDEVIQCIFPARVIPETEGFVFTVFQISRQMDIVLSRKVFADLHINNRVVKIF